MSKTQAALQRRLGRLSMLIDICERQLSALPHDQSELISNMKRELELVKELSMRLVEMPRQNPCSDVDSERPAVTSRRP